MKKYTNRIKLMPKFTKCMSLAMILTFTSYEEAFAEMSYAEQTSFTVSMENQTLKSVINWVEKNSQFIFIYRTDIDLSRRVNVDVRNKTIEEVLKQMFAGTDLEYHIRDRQVIIRKAISREKTPPIVMQQEKVTVKGIVTDAKGEAIIGANIIEKGTTNGTITDIDGQFTLMVSEKASLVFSYIGYLTQEMVVGKKPFLNVQLQEDNKTLDEVVITGYGGTQLRSKMTNSIAKVDNSTLSTGVHTNPAQALSGAVAGLRVQQTSGNPNSTPTLVLRGGTNLDGSGSPLVIIDGVGTSHEMNTTGKKGTAKVQGVPGLYKNPQNANLPTTDWDWTIDPMGIRMCCREITSRYDLPIVISENGLGAFDKLEDGEVHDPYRIAYLKAHIEELKKACDDGCRVLAYCTWSYTDLLSWLNGYQKRYGFVYVDREEDENSGTLNRYKKDSYYWYKKVIETNGEEL